METKDDLEIFHDTHSVSSVVKYSYILDDIAEAIVKFAAAGIFIWVSLAEIMHEINKVRESPNQEA